VGENFFKRDEGRPCWCERKGPHSKPRFNRKGGRSEGYLPRSAKEENNEEPKTHRQRKRRFDIRRTSREGQKKNGGA